MVRNLFVLSAIESRQARCTVVIVSTSASHKLEVANILWRHAVQRFVLFNITSPFFAKRRRPMVG